MTELKKIVAHNIATLRVKAHLTQFELGEKLSYSDKAVSRWERGEAIPDAYVLLMMADIFGVTVDYILKEHSSDEEEKQQDVIEEEKAPVVKLRGTSNHKKIATISFLAVWALALLTFVLTAIAGRAFWLCFIYALPVSSILLLVLNSLWGKRKYNLFLVSVILWGVLLSLHLSLLFIEDLWMIYFIGLPAQVIIPIAFSIRKNNKGKNNRS